MLEIVNYSINRGYKYIVADCVSKGGRALAKKVGFQFYKRTPDYIDLEYEGRKPYAEIKVRGKDGWVPKIKAGEYMQLVYLDLEQFTFKEVVAKLNLKVRNYEKEELKMLTATKVDSKLLETRIGDLNTRIK